MSNSNYIEKLNFRYATKKFDSSKQLSESQVEDIKKAIQLSASSYGLQPYEVLIIKNMELREKLKTVSYNQPQITDASHLIVFCANTKLNQEHVDNYINNISETRQQPTKELEGFKDAINGTLNSLDDQAKQTWAEKQIYIALGNLLSAVAHFDLDACPMEGFDNNQYDEILGLHDKNLHATVIAPVGYRSEDDQVQHLAKVRKPLEELFTEL